MDVDQKLRIRSTLQPPRRGTIGRDVAKGFLFQGPGHGPSLRHLAVLCPRHVFPTLRRFPAQELVAPLSETLFVHSSKRDLLSSPNEMQSSTCDRYASHFLLGTVKGQGSTGRRTAEIKQIKTFWTQLPGGESHLLLHAISK